LNCNERQKKSWFAMSTITGFNVPQLGMPNVPKSLGAVNTASNRFETPNFGSDKDELREKFTQFVGETFYGQMIKSMRSTVGKPAYFHGGQAEEAFRGQLDQYLSQHLTEATADRFAEPLFKQQFPHLANDEAPTGGVQHSLDQLDSLSRR
jgi:Rod binding domain-containing protein